MQTGSKITVFILIILVGIFSIQILNTLKPSFITADDLVFEEEEATVRAIQKVQPAVVSVVVYDYEDFYALINPSGTKEVQKRQKVVQRGTGFIISPDGYIITNKHVTEAGSEDSDYKVVLNSGKEYYAQLIDEDRINDLAIIKIFDKDLPIVELGDSSRLEIGMSVIAIGNALGKYENSVTKGIVSGLNRELTASNPSGFSEELKNVIQTDAQINPGNSGGPLVNLKGEVVGINTAIENTGSSIGFAIPINDAKQVIGSIISDGIIKRPYLGVRFQTLTKEMAQSFNLPRESGAWIYSGNEVEDSVVPGSAADIGGIEDRDIIFEINAVEITEENTLLDEIQKFQPGDKIGLKIQRGEKIVIKIVELGSF